MSNRRRHTPKTPDPNDPNHYKFNFERFVPARFANLDRLFGLTWKVAAIPFATAAAGMWHGYSSHNLPTYFTYVIAVLGLVGVAAITEVVRSLRQFQTKIVFAAIYVLVMLGSATVTGLVLWQINVDWGLTQEELKQRRENEQRERDRQKKEQDDAAARKAEETRRAKCEQDRKWVIAKAEKERPAAHDALVACTTAYERKRKTAEDTVAQRCLTEVNALWAIDRRKQQAETKKCDTPAPK